MVNLNEFTRFGIEWKRGDYKKLNKHSVEYRLLWQEQLNRCYNGHSIGGEYISGFLYWYVNFGSIELLRDDGKGKHKGTPLLRDIEVIIDKEVRQCQTDGINLMLMTGRRGGKSYWGSGMASHNAIFHADKSLICAFDTDKRDNMMKMCQTHLNGMLETEFFIPILKGTYQSDLILGYAKRDPETKKYIDTFTGGVIHSRIFKNNKTAANGLSARVAIFEEVGMFNNLIESYNATKYCWMDGGTQFGFALLVGTGGDMEKGSIDAAKMFEDPEAYDLKVFEDPENPQKKTGLFIPAQFTLNDFKDDHGNTDLLKSTEYLTGVREKLKKARNINTLYEEIQYRPMRWQEVFLKSSGNIFNAALIQDQINKISMDRTLQNIGTRGMLEWAGGYTRFVPDDNLREVEFPVNKHKENKGCVTIYEHPFEEVKGDHRTIPFGLYLAGCLLPGEQVMTEKGLMNIEDVELDNKLINKEGEYVDIINLQRYEKVDEDIYELSVSNTYRTTSFTKEHPIFVSDQFNYPDKRINEFAFEFSFKKVENIKEGQWIKVPNIYKKEVVSIIPEKEDIYWLLGIWIGNGWRDRGNKISVCFHNDHQESIDKYIRIVKEVFNRDCYKRIKGATEITFSHYDFSCFIDREFGKYSYGKIIPEWIKFLEHELKKYFVLGYLETDGCIHLSKSKRVTMEFVSVNLELLESIQDILFSFNIVGGISKLRDAKIGIIKNRNVSQREIYHLRYNQRDTILFKELFKEGESFKLDKISGYKEIRTSPKKGCFISNCGNYIYFKISKINKKKYTGTVYNFECDTNSFMCHHITTHNCDPYQQDQASSSVSVGSTFIYKRIIGLDKTYDVIVAEYTGRPLKSDDYFDMTRKLLVYYNAKCLYENNIPTMKAYFEQKQCLHLLAKQPNILKDILEVSGVERGYGVHMTQKVKMYLVDTISNWINTERGDGIYNIHHVYSMELLKELLNYNFEDNFDRVIAFGMCLLKDQEEYKNKVQDNDSRELHEKFFSPMFSRAGFDDKKYKPKHGY